MAWLPRFGSGAGAESIGAGRASPRRCASSARSGFWAGSSSRRPWPVSSSGGGSINAWNRDFLERPPPDPGRGGRLLVCVAMDASAMTSFSLPSHSMIALMVGISALLLAGALIGAFHFLSLKWTVAMLTKRQALPAFGLQLFRFMVTGAALLAVACSFGAMPLMLAGAGVLMTRAAILRREAQP